MRRFTRPYEKSTHSAPGDRSVILKLDRYPQLRVLDGSDCKGVNSCRWRAVMRYGRLMIWTCLAVTLAASAPTVSAQLYCVHINRRSPTNVSLVDLNSATREELLTLPSIGEAEADAIIKGRPYETKQRLVEGKILTKGVYEKIEKRLTTIAPPPRG